jgi:hypothetical protein
MASNQKKIVFDAPKQDVFTRFTNALMLDLNQKSTTFNTSYAQPIGTEFQYNEHNFGQTVRYTVKITEHEKPTRFAYTLASKSDTLQITCFFDDNDLNQTVMTYSIILKNNNFFQRLKNAKLIKDIDKKFSVYAEYTKKISASA